MKKRKEKSRKELREEISELKNRLDEAREALEAIRSGEVDALVVQGPEGEQVFTLKTAEHAYRLMVETMTEGAATLSAEGTVIYCNNSLAGLLNIQLQKLIGTSLLDFVDPRDRALFTALIAKGLENCGKGEVIFMTPEGKKVMMYVSAYKFISGASQNVCVIFTDLTEQKRAKEVMDRSRRLSDMGTLAATVAHELRNPLAVIKIAVANIKRKKSIEGIDKHLHNIEKKVSESDQIINNLLFYSRLRVPHAQLVNMFDLLQESLAAFETRSKNKKIELEKNFEPLKKEPITVDALQIKEVFTNILDNSYDAVDTNGRISVFGESKNGSMIIRFSDNGMGIDRTHLRKVFEPFFTTKSKGTGLGLSVCNQIVNMHGGQIDIQSEPGKGTTVTVSLAKK